MNFYKITFYVIIFIVLLFLLYKFYNYVKKITIVTNKIEPFYDFTTDIDIIGPPKDLSYSMKTIIFFDIIETNGYGDSMEYLWYSMPYYNDILTIDDSGKIIIPDTYFTNNGTERTTNALLNANGIFAKYVDEQNNDDYINYAGAAIILARPNIHRFNLKNFILTKGNIPTGFNNVDMMKIKDIYNVLYKINFWYRVGHTGFYDNNAIGDKLDSNVTGFDYIKYIFIPEDYISTSANIYYGIYIRRYYEFITKILGYDYYGMNDEMKLIYDINIPTIQQLNLTYGNIGPVIKDLKLLLPDLLYRDEKFKNRKNPYASYLERMQLYNDNSFKLNVNAISRIIMDKCINSTSTSTPASTPLTYDDIFKGTEFETPVKSGGISSDLKDFFNNFFILNSLYALYADRYYYVDVNYYNTSKASKSILSFSGKKFVGGETFTESYKEWLDGIGISQDDTKARLSDYVNSDETEFKETQQNFESYCYEISPYDDSGSIKIKNYEDPSQLSEDEDPTLQLSEYFDPIIPISKLYRGTTYVDAINMIDGGKIKDKVTEDRKAQKAKIISTKNELIQEKDDSRKRIINIIRNQKVRKLLMGKLYKDFEYSRSPKYMIMKKETFVDDNFRDITIPSFSILVKGALPVFRLTQDLLEDDDPEKGFSRLNKITLVDLPNIARTKDSAVYSEVVVKKYLLSKDETDVVLSGYEKKLSYPWLGFSSIQDAVDTTNLNLYEAAKKLAKLNVGIGYDVQWYNDIISKGVNETTAAGIGSNFDAVSDRGVAIINIAKDQVIKFEREYSNKKEEDWKAYWKYPLIGGDASNPSLDTLLEEEKRKYDGFVLATGVYDIKLKMYYTNALTNYNNIFTTVIPGLLTKTMEKLNDSIVKINLFNSFIQRFSDLTVHNLKWENITKSKSINKIVNVSYKKDDTNISKKETTATILNLFKNIKRNDFYETDDFNIVEIENLMPTMVEFGVPKTPSVADNVYKDETIDYLIYLKTANPDTNFKNKIEGNFFKEPESYYKKTANFYKDIYNHPKILMRYSTPYFDGSISSDKKSGFSVFDIGILLRIIFDNDITDYLNGTEKYNNYDFPTLFQYNSNDVINIKAKTDVLSDENYEKLSINSKLNNFFDVVDQRYKEFNSYNLDSSKGKLAVDYFNFSNTEKTLRSELTVILDELIKNDKSQYEIIKFSYTTNFVSSVNCLITMYTDDVCNIILPLYKQLRDMFDSIVNVVYDFNSSEFQSVLKTAEDENFENKTFKTFYEKYTKLFGPLNNGIAGQKSSQSVDNLSPGETKNIETTGTLNYLFNIHNLLLNLILRTFYYYNNFMELRKKYGDFILNKFDASFTDIFKDTGFEFSLTNEYLVNNCNIFTEMAYLKSTQILLTDSLILYKTKITKCCYNHILVKMINIIYQMNKNNNYIYESDSENAKIEKGETLTKTIKLYENMLETLKNGEIYIDSIYAKFGFRNETSRENDPIVKRYDQIFKKIKDSFKKYLDTVFYIGNSKLYGCFKGNLSTYYSSLGFSKHLDENNNITDDKTSKLISNVNNMDTDGNVTKFGAIINCINDTIAHNKSIETDISPGTSNKNGVNIYDLVAIVPYNQASQSDKEPSIDTYSCYAGKSSTFKSSKKKKEILGFSELNKCSLKYTDDKGDIDKDFKNRVTSNTIIYKIDVSNNYDSTEVAFLGCFKKNIPDMGIYNTLPNFIGNISGSLYNDPTTLMGLIKKLVDNYNDNFGTNYDIYGITTNLENTLELDVYAGDSKVDAVHAKTAKNDAYQENCNIYYPGPDNYMIYQNKTNVLDPCLSKEVNYLQNYNDYLTDYLNKNMTTHQESINELGSDINLLKNLFPIKFSVSQISNSKDNASISIDTSKSIGFDSKNSSMRTCALSITVKEGPKGIEGDSGISGEKGKNVKGIVGDLGNAGYWGSSKN